MLLSACIFSTTPPAGTVSLTWSQNQVFKVSGLGTYKWFLDGAQVGVGSSYTFKSSAHVLGTYQLKVISTLGSISNERAWDISVISVPALVPTASSCSDITNVGLICNTDTSCSPTVSEGGVITQTPAPGESVPAGSTVLLLVSSGQCVNHEVAVPAATGCASLAAAGFICSTTTSCNNDVPAGVVLFQDPPAGTLAMQGTTVSLVLSSGPCTAEEVVPNATNCADVEAAGFVCSRIRECSMTVPLDGVITQSPPPGFMAMPGSVVALTLSSGMCQAQVPNATTCEEIVAEGLVCNKVEICTNDYPVPGTFLSLSPAAGTGISRARL
jgi:beta-lactam-binding protein with PASTA domain